MPTVLGINQVPYGIPKPPGFLGNVGQLGGTVSRQVVDALLAALLGNGGGFGRVPTTPTPQNPGQLTFPSGTSTPTNPQELAQIQSLGGIPARQGGTVPLGQPAAGGVSYTAPTRLGFKPNLDYQVKQAQLQKAQQDLDPNSPMNQYIRSLTTANQPQPGSATDASGGFTQSLQTLRESADAGDEQAVKKLRLILQLLQES